MRWKDNTNNKKNFFLLVKCNNYQADTTLIAKHQLEVGENTILSVQSVNMWKQEGKHNRNLVVSFFVLAYEQHSPSIFVPCGQFTSNICTLTTPPKKMRSNKEFGDIYIYIYIYTYIYISGFPEHRHIISSSGVYQCQLLSLFRPGDRPWSVIPCISCYEYNWDTGDFGHSPTSFAYNTVHVTTFLRLVFILRLPDCIM